MYMIHYTSLLRRLHHTTEFSEAPRPEIPQIPAVRLGAELLVEPTGPTGPTEPGIRMGNLGILLEICQNQLFVSR